MNTRQITFLLFLSAVIGSIMGFLGNQFFNRDSKKFSSLETVQHLNSLSDEDFLKMYPDEKHLLTLGEQTFGDRLFRLLETRSQNVNTPKKSDPKTKYTNEDLQSEELTKDELTESNDNLSYFSRSGINLSPRAVPGAKLQRIFKNTKFNTAGDENFGIENGLIENAKEFLQKQGCKNPSFTAITEEKKNRSNFFDFVKDNTFKGSTTIAGTAKEPVKNFETKIEFNSPTHSGFDYFEVKDHKKNYLEKRVVKIEPADDAWRYSSCEPAVILVSDKCPWNNQFVYEFKSFYVSPDSKKMVGNVYCKRPSDQEWTNVGIFDLNQSLDE